MERIEEPHSVEQHGRAVARATADEGNGGEVRGRGRRRRDRGHPQDIRLQDRRETSEQHGIDHERVAGQPQRVSGPTVTDHLEALEADGRGPQQHPYGVGRRAVVGVGPRRVAERCHFDADRPLVRYPRHHERPETVGGCRPRHPLRTEVRNGDFGKGHRLQIDAVAHHARKRCLLQCRNEHGCATQSRFSLVTRMRVNSPMAVPQTQESLWSCPAMADTFPFG